MLQDNSFRAAIFDLDGTLLNSMYVWALVDELFFTVRGIEVPEGYVRAIAGLSYRDSAVYTKELLGLSESWEEIVAEWTAMAEREYAHHVRLKPGAERYLRRLKADGKKLAVATAMPPALFGPCLKNNGVYDLFDALLSTADAGGGGKDSGKIYALAAKRLGVSAGECVVFEDVYEGVLGARRAGMRVFCVFDAATHRLDEAAALADGLIYDFEEWIT